MVKNNNRTTFMSSFFSQQILDLKDRASLIEKIQKDRLENLLPKLMSKNGIDMDNNYSRI